MVVQLVEINICGCKMSQDKLVKRNVEKKLQFLF